MSTTRILAVLPVTGTIYGGYHLTVNTLKSLQHIVHAAFVALKEAYFYSFGKHIKLLDTKFVMTRTLDQLNERLRAASLGLVTMVPILGGLYRNRHFDKKEEAYEKCQEADVLYKQNKIKEAFDKYTEAAELGSSDAHYQITKIYALGHPDIIRTTANGIQYHLEDAAKNKEPGSLGLLALYDLGVAYKTGELGEPNEKLAFSYFQAAAFRYEPQAQNALGEAAEEGTFGQTKNQEVAVDWYQRAIFINNNISARVNLARCLLYGKGIKEDVPQGLKLLEEVSAMDPKSEFFGKKINSDQGKAQFYLGEYWIKKNPGRFQFYFQEAAKNGNEAGKAALLTHFPDSFAAQQYKVQAK